MRLVLHWLPKIPSRAEPQLPPVVIFSTLHSLLPSFPSPPVSLSLPYWCFWDHLLNTLLGLESSQGLLLGGPLERDKSQRH